MVAVGILMSTAVTAISVPRSLRSHDEEETHSREWDSVWHRTLHSPWTDGVEVTEEMEKAAERIGGGGMALIQEVEG